MNKNMDAPSAPALMNLYIIASVDIVRLWVKDLKEDNSQDMVKGRLFKI